MAVNTSSLGGTNPELLLRDCVSALERVAAYRLPVAMDRRLQWLAENKDALSGEEREELLALAEFAEQRTREKLQAETVLKRVAETCPDLLCSQP